MGPLYWRIEKIFQNALYSLFWSSFSWQLSSSMKSIFANIPSILRIGAVFETFGCVSSRSNSTFFSSLFSDTLPWTTSTKLEHPPISFSVSFNSSMTRKICSTIFTNSFGYVFLNSCSVHVIRDFCIPSLGDQWLNCHAFPGTLPVGDFVSWFYIFRLWDI